ncbi:replication protein P [Gammaproteobacteria bacterium]|nr:replication protein P [Gammaproteobacteria bacterium]
MTPLGHQKLNSNKEEFIECIDSLFLKLELAYHYQFYKVFGTDDRLNEGKKLWATSLKSFSTETILEGIESVVGSQSYLPTLTDLIKACSEINNQDGFPSVEEAYIEARKSFSPRAEYPWSHPIVYFAGKKIGWNFLDEKDSKELFFSFKKIFNKLKLEAFNGNEFKIEQTANQPSLTPLNKKLFESLRKKHNV